MSRGRARPRCASASSRSGARGGADEAASGTRRTPPGRLEWGAAGGQYPRTCGARQYGRKARAHRPSPRGGRNLRLTSKPRRSVERRL
jgi:hypothetical protein